MLLRYHEELLKFYESNEAFLQQTYPGLSFHRLTDDFQRYSNLFSDDFVLDKRSINRFIEQVKEGMPLEHISKTAYFYEHEFYVDSRVLIPRSETEILVEKSLEHIKRNDFRQILDLGTGSGCIPLSIAAALDQHMMITGVDLSIEALDVAKINHNRLQHHISKTIELSWVQGDFLNQSFGQFDMIVSNPPYIPGDDQVHSQVKKYEPEIALYIDREFKDYFSLLFQRAGEQLRKGGLFLMEGHEDHLHLLVEVMQSHGFINIEIIHDYTQRNRFIQGEYNG